MRFFRGVFGTCLILFLLAEVLFLSYISFPRSVNFDEFHYVPAAKQWLALEDTRNWEHPPLGKMLIAIGMGIFGDRPLGWRFMSTVFGSLTLAGMYLWGLSIFRRRHTALFVAALTAVNFLLYVQARIGMLDTFMMAFMTFGFAAFCASWSVRRSPDEVFRLQLFSGAMFGLAASCKWAAVVPWLFCAGLYVLVRVLRGWRTRFEGESPWITREPEFEDWYSPGLWKGFGWHHFALCWIVAPLLVYFATFLPYLFVSRTPAYTLWDLVLMQPKMWSGQLRVVNTHPYMSKWWEWPLLIRPIWYAFNREGEEAVRGVILLGNPLLMWSGLLAWLYCLWAWFFRRSRQAFLIAVIYGLLVFSWAVVPRKVAFYYYYFPAGMTLSLAIAFVFHHVEQSLQVKWARWVFAAIALGFFIHFFPILSAMKIGEEEYRQWMWLRRWI